MKSDFSKLHALQDALQKKILKKAIRAGTKLVLAAVRGRVPVASGALKKSLTSKVDSAKGSTTVYGIVGPRSKWQKVFKGKVKKPSRYAHFIERGRFARPFLMPAFQANKQAYLNAVQDVVAAEIKAVLS